jgi:DNA-binding CsgD family transcriptional regulator/tetratricopeptide (TPR) repeat protein
LVERVLDRIDGSAGVVLTGPPGVGKSRVARVIAAAAARRGAVVEWIQATDATRDMPLGAFGPLLPTDADASTPLELLRKTASSLRTRSRGRRLVLVVDDTHLLDPASATLVHQTVQSGNAFVLATLRTGVEVPDAIVSLWKDGLAERIDVDALDEPDVAQVVRAALDGEVEVATAHRLWSATRGNALYLHELVLAGVRSGALHAVDGTWRWRGPLTGDGTLLDVLEVRLAGLDDRQRNALDVLAVGEPLGIEVFEGLVGIDVVDDLERQDLIRIWRDERREEASLAHPLYRDLLKQAMGSDELALAQERLAQAVEAAGGRRRGDLLRVALWRLAGPVEARADLLVAAAAEAEFRFDLELAERLARVAVERDESSTSWHALASSLRAQGRNDEADDAWARALDIETDAARRVGLAQSRAANLFFGMGDGGRAVAALDAVILDATTQDLRDTIGSLVGMFDLYRGRIDTALAAAVPILERGGVGADARIDAALTASAGYALRGRPADAIAVVDTNIAIALQQPEVSSIAAGALMAARLLAQSMDGRLIEALDSARVVYDLAVDMGTHDGVAGLSFAIGQLYESMGDVASARRHLSEGLALLREHDRNGYLPWCLAELALTHVLAGDLTDAAEALADADRHEQRDLRLFRPRVDTARYVLRAIEDPEEGIAGLVRTAEGALADGHLVLGAMAYHEAIRFGGAAVVAGPLARLVVSTDSGLVRAFAMHARAAASTDGAELDDVATTFETMGALLSAVDAATAAAAAHAAQGANARRVASQQRAESILDRCAGARPPWVVRSTGDALSARELEVAALAATGLSSREIADRLYVSVRTVDNHLYRLYAKLGVDNRDDLAVVFRLRRGSE